MVDGDEVLMMKVEDVMAMRRTVNSSYAEEETSRATRTSTRIVL